MDKTKRKPGRPRLPSGIVRKLVSLDQETAARLCELRVINLSAWIREQVAKAWTRKK